MTDLEILREMIKDSARVETTEHYGRTTVELIESQHPDSTVKVFGLPDDVIVIKVDAFHAPDAIFAGSQGECKRADFVIIGEVSDAQVVIYIEMKATKAYSGPRNLDNENGWNKVLNYHAQTVQCYL